MGHKKNLYVSLSLFFFSIFFQNVKIMVVWTQNVQTGH